MNWTAWLGVDPAHIAKIVSVTSCVLCMAICLRTAMKWARARSEWRIFSALAMLAFTWALLFLYYVDTAQNETLGSLSGFTLFYIGVLLSRQGITIGQDDFNKSLLGRMVMYEPLVLYLMCMLLFPSGVLFTFGSTIITTKVTVALEQLMATILSCMGYLAVLGGAQTLMRAHGERRPRYAWPILVLLSTVYFFLEVYYCANTWLAQVAAASSGAAWGMPTEFKIAFAMLKIPYTLAIARILTYYQSSVKDRSYWSWLLEAIGIQAKHEPAPPQSRHDLKASSTHTGPQP